MSKLALFLAMIGLMLTILLSIVTIKLCATQDDAGKLSDAIRMSIDNNTDPISELGEDTILLDRYWFCY